MAAAGSYPLERCANVLDWIDGRHADAQTDGANPVDAGELLLNREPCLECVRYDPH